MANVKISELSPLITVQDADVLPIVDNAVTKKVTAAILRSYTQGNSVLLTGAQTVAGIKTFTSQIASSVATGTAPFSVASTTKVTNLNADLLDGLSSADFQATLSGTGIVKSTSGTISYLTDNTANWDAAYNDKINSAAVTGIGTNTLTLTQQDAGTITATWVNGTLIREIRNNTGATLTKGTIVYISGATGNKPTVSKAIATGDSTSAQTFGFVQENILNNANGNVVVIGDLTGVDTSAFAEGAQLYLSATTAGTFTDVKQYAPNHLVYVGIVTRAHPTLGQIEVNIQNGYELDELHNVAAQSPSNGDILQYVTSTGLWTKIGGTTSAISEGSNLYFTNARSRSAISLTTTGTSGAATYNSTTGVLNVPNYADTDTGITSLNGLTALTQTFAVGTSGTDFGISSATSTHTFNLPTASATNRGALSSTDWTTFNNKQNALTNPITGTGTTNYLPKFTGASALGNSLVFDNGTGVGVNTNTPASKLQVEGANYSFIAGSDAGNRRVLIGLDTSGEPSIQGTLSNGTARQLSINPAGGNVGIGTTSPASGRLQVNGTGSTDATNVIFTDNSSGAATFAVRDNGNVFILGNLGIGTGSPSYKLDVNGNERIKASGVSPILYVYGGGDNAGTNSGKGNIRSGDSVELNYFDFGRDNLNTGNFVITSNNSSPLLSITTGGAATFSGSITTTAGSVNYGGANTYVFGDNTDLYLGTSGNSRIKITSAGLVGIGTASPSEKLNIDGAGARLLIQDTNQGGSGFIAGRAASEVFLGNNGAIPLSFLINNAEKMRITPAGNVGIGTASPNTRLHTTGSLTVDDIIYLQRASSSLFLPIANYWNGSGSPLAGTKGDILAIGNAAGDGLVFVNSNTERMRIDGNGATFASGVALSGATAQSSGIEFPATQVASASANNLDDYEEGTWTMGIAFNGSSTGVTYTSNTGNYTKIGRQVTVVGYVVLSSKGSSTGSASITGLPFTIGSTNANFSTANFYMDKVTFANQFQGYGNINSTNIIIEETTSLGITTAITDVDFANNSNIIVSLTYFV